MLVSYTLSGCALMFSGSKETLYVRSDEKDTVFLLGAREIGRGYSAVANISKKKLGDDPLMARKEGCSPVSTPVVTEFDPLTLLGLILDYGLFTILIVDWAATGAVTKAAQTDYILTPNCT